MRVLVLGATGMLGAAVHRVLSESGEHEVWGTVRGVNRSPSPDSVDSEHLLGGVDACLIDSLIGAFSEAKPDVVINCIGIVKQLAAANDPLVTLPVNSMLPHQLARLCDVAGARLVHVSTDCVFSGRRGAYLEDDVSDAEDLYGKSKYIGEVSGSRNVVTLRTSIIGHESDTKHSLVDWFLSQSGSVKGFTRAIFSGLPTVELSRVIRDYVLPNYSMYGLYHVASNPISKFELLSLIAEVYGHLVKIEPDDEVVIDRSLNAARFTTATGYHAPAWPDLIRRMYVCQNTKG